MVRRQFPSALLLATLLALGATAGVLAKDDAIVTLDASLPANPEPGSEITVGWTVETLGENGTREPFNADSMFVRVTPPTGEPVEVVGTQGPAGHYVATVTVPPGGIEAVALGLRGESCTAGTCQPSDIMFTIDDSAMPVFEPAPPATVTDGVAAPEAPAATTSPANVGGGPLPWAVVGLALATAILLAMIALRARGRAFTPGSSRS